MGTRRSSGTFVAMAVSTPCTDPPSVGGAGGRSHPPVASATGQSWPGLAGGAVPAGSLGPAGAPRTRPGRTVTAVLAAPPRPAPRSRAQPGRTAAPPPAAWPRGQWNRTTGLTPPETRAARSALGPHGTGNRWSSTDTNGHGWRTRIAGHRVFVPAASGIEAARRRVRAPPPAPWPWGTWGAQRVGDRRAAADSHGQQAAWSQTIFHQTAQVGSQAAELS
jgi:hypothetical protein